MYLGMSFISPTGKPSTSGNIEDITSSFPLPLPIIYIPIKSIIYLSSICLDEDYTITAFVGEDTSIV